MFNYLGQVIEHITARSQTETTAFQKGYDVYKVLVTALAQEPVEAAVLTFPGIELAYDVGDIVVLAELEQRKQNGVDLFILGRLQKALTRAELEAGKRYTVAKIEVAQLEARGNGNIAADVHLGAKTEGINAMSADSLLVALKSARDEINVLKSEILELRNWKNSLGLPTTP